MRLDNYERIECDISSNSDLERYLNVELVSRRQDEENVSSDLCEFRITDRQGNIVEYEKSVPAEYGEYTGANMNYNYSVTYCELDGNLYIYERISALFEHDGVKEAADIGGIRIYLEYNSDRKCMELSDEYVFDGYDTRKLPGQDINLNDCEVVTGERDDIRELTRARYQLTHTGTGRHLP